MKDASHEAFTKWVFDFLAQKYPFEPYFRNYKDANIRSAIGTDYSSQSPGIELVLVGAERDDPHSDQLLTLDDKPLKQAFNSDVITFNHYIDLEKGPGIFDDYDGYSYMRGSASKNDYQSLGDYLKNDKPNIWEGASGTMGKILKGLHSDWGLEDAKNHALSSLYVHAPGHPGYRDNICSPAIEKYSFYMDKGIYSSMKDEAKARFPLVGTRYFVDMLNIHKNEGIPYSVFIPIDNIARYWYNEFLRDKARNQAALGTVMHAIQDCSVPHHASGYGGNWHDRYETKLRDNSATLLANTAQVKELLTKWQNNNDPNPPTSLGLNDWAKVPAKNWRIDMLATWVALNAHKEYNETYAGFKNGFSFNIDSAIKLSNIARAMCAFVAINAVNPNTKPPVKPSDPVPKPPEVPKLVSISRRRLGNTGRILVEGVSVSGYDPNGDDIKFQFEILEENEGDSEVHFTGNPNHETNWISWSNITGKWFTEFKFGPMAGNIAFRIRAMDRSGRYSAWSNPIPIITENIEVPNPGHGGPGTHHPEEP